MNRTSRFRTDIQALRALAIAAVVVNHLWPARAPGGYVGVDVFFVISGFLITSHLFGELARTGGVRLGAFYARRIRRLLPAALLVLTVSALLVALFLPYPRWERNAWEILASAGYVENWVLAAMSINYSALNDSASVAQHYWSLSVEEQFYLVWPVVMVAAVWLGTRLARSSSLRHRVFIVLAVIGALSLLASILYTESSPSQAYFATFTRAWEFAAGGLVALAAHRFSFTRLWANASTAVGFAAIAVAVFVFDDQTHFPGSAALLPVLGTALVIAAGGSMRLWHTFFSASKPVQWLGGISYSLYLWHWPLIVVAPFVLASELTTIIRIGILVAALVLAWMTKRLIEDPGQRWKLWSTSVRRALSGMLAGILVVALASTALLVTFSIRAAADSPDAPVVAGSCSGPAALENIDGCEEPFGPPKSAVMTANNEYFHTPSECSDFIDGLSYGDTRTTRVCDYSDGSPDAERVWLVGDSHAQQWQGALFDLAKERGWLLTISYYGGCPVAAVDFVGFRGPWATADAEQCMRWSSEVTDAILDDAPDVVFSSMGARHQLVDDGTGRAQVDQFAEGLEYVWTLWANAGIQVIAIADPPFNGEVRDPDCVLLNAQDPERCATPRDLSQPRDPIVVAAEAARHPLIRAVDLTERFCDTRRCYAVVGGIPVYYDADHLNLEYVRLLAPTIGEAVDQISSVGVG